MAGDCKSSDLSHNRFDPYHLHQEQRMGYIIQYESQGTAVNPWAGNSTYNNVTGSSDLLIGTGLKTNPAKYYDNVE